MKQMIRTLLTALAAVALVTSAAGAAAPPFTAGYPQAFTEQAADRFDKALAVERQAELHGWLLAERPPLAKAAGLSLPFPSARMADLERLTTEERRYAVGVGEATDVTVDLAGRPAIGAKHAMADGGYVWTSTVQVAGASALRLYFEDLALPAKTELYLYNDFGQVRGPYTGNGPGAKGSFWSHAINGDTLYLQLRSIGVPAKGFAAAPYFRITEVGVMGDRFLKGLMGTTLDLGKSFCSFNEPCTENASCSSIPGAIAPARDAAALYLFRSGGSFFICSGGLLADTDTSSQIPFFLTANHCLSKGREASSVEAYFQFSTPCNGTCFSPQGGAVPTVLGASILATSRNSDFTLLRLDQPAPAGSAFLGWTAAPVAFSNNTNLFRISHPAGAPQAYSEQRVDTSAGTCSSLPRGNFIYSRDTFGATEGGSSGSPVLNSAGQVVGQLFGACGFNVNDPCDAASNATVDGAFAATFPSVAQFLDASPGGCTDADNDGFCSDVDCNDNNAAINPGAAEVCGDLIDNNCNGAIDEGCSVCTPSGAACSVNGDCCSNKCRGPSGNKTCR